MKPYFVPLLFAVAVIAYAQQPPAADTVSEAVLVSDEAVLAMTRPDYPVTPGDVYRLTYTASVNSVLVSAILDSAYRLNLGFLGTIDARGLTFQALKQRVQDSVRGLYPNSHPEFVIASIGRYEVYVTGRVERTGYVRASGLSRLSDIVRSRVLGTGSIRTVTLVRDGRRTTYDLFLAARFGRSDQDPYVRPGDRIEVAAAARLVSIAGAVNRPGTYELLSGEDLTDLLSRFADDVGPDAAIDRMYLDRRSTAETPERIHVVNVRSQTLRDRDHVVVPSRTGYFPFVTIQGAVIAPPFSLEDPQTAETIDGRLMQFTHRFRPGETLGQTVRSISDRLSPRADLARAEYFRAGIDRPIPIDLRAFVSDYDSSIDIVLGAGDRIVIPFGTFEVFVTGEVTRARHVNVESVTRLSSAVRPLFTDYSSARDVSVTTVDGVRATYDLFEAERFGRRDQNPYLRPGDTVEVSRAVRTVTLEGEVRRPGTYQLMPGEKLERLVEHYGDGLTLDADPGSLQITRTLTDAPSGREVIELDLTVDRAFEPVDGDRVRVHSEARELPFLEMAGAVFPEQYNEETVLGYAVRRFPIVPGQSLRSFVRDRRSIFQPTSDLSAAVLQREDGSELPIDLSVLLFEAADRSPDLTVRPGDRIVIPFERRIVVVAGAVANPGTFAFVPNRSVDYYVNLAGGYDSTRTWFRRPRVVSRDGETLDTRKVVPAEATIVVPANNPFFALQIATFASLATSIVSLLLLIR